MPRTSGKGSAGPCTTNVRLSAHRQEMHVQKALVYLAVKQINYLGRSVHAEDAGHRARYNLDILYRRVRRAPVEGPQPVPAPAPTQPR